MCTTPMLLNISCSRSNEMQIKLSCLCLYAGIPMEEEEEEQDTSLKGRLMAIIYKIKGRPQKTEEEPTKQEQATPSKALIFFKLHFFYIIESKGAFCKKN